jgi:hypothetical protein
MDGGLFKRCECQALFAVEFSRCGQLTSRRLCDDCRDDRAKRKSDVLRHVPANAPRCLDCEALVGLQYGSSITHLDDKGRCTDCAAWEKKRVNILQRRQTLALIDRLKANVAALEAQLAAEPAHSQPLTPETAVYLVPEVKAVEIAAAYLALDALARHHLEDAAQLEGPRRDTETAAARQGVMQALRARGWPVTLIAALLNRHHTTVLHGLQRTGPQQTQWRLLYEDFLRAVVPDPVTAPALAAQLQRRAVAIEPNHYQARRDHARLRPAVPGPAGHVCPSILARRWQVPPGTVRYWIAQGRVPAVKGADGRLWIDPATPHPGAVAS